MKIKNFFTKAKKEKNEEIPNFFQNRINFISQKQNDKVLLQKAFTNICFAYINKRSQSLSNQESKIFITDNKNETLISENHWLWQLFDGRPNPYTTWRVLRSQIQMWLDVYGNAYLFTPPSTGGVPTQAWLLPSAFVKIEVNNGKIKNYVVSYLGSSFELDPNYVCHFKTLKPNSTDWNSNFFEGSPSLLQASVAAIGADDELINYVQNFFLREGTTPFVLSSQNLIPNEQYEKFRARWNENLQDYPLKAVLEGGLVVNPLPSFGGNINLGSLKDIDNIILTRLGAIWGVAPALITSNYNARATMEILKEEFYHDTIDPLLTEYEDTLTDHFRQWDPMIFFSHSQLGYIDSETLFNHRLALYQSGVLTKNELRNFEGLAPLPDGDNINSQNNEKKLTKKNYFIQSWNNIPEEFKNYIWHKYEKIQNRYLLSLENSIKNAYIEIHKTLNLEDLINSQKNVKDGISTDFDIDGWDEILEKHASPELKKLIKNIFDAAQDEIGSYYEEAEFQIKVKKSLENSLSKIKISNNTIAEELRTVIQDAVRNNPFASSSELFDKIRTAVDNKFNDVYTVSRAKLIARTSSTYSTGYVQSTVWHDNGFATAWLSVRDGKVRESHALADGQVKGEIVPNAYIVNGLITDFPGNTGSPSEDCNCRCSQFPIKRE